MRESSFGAGFRSFARAGRCTRQSLLRVKAGRQAGSEFFAISRPHCAFEGRQALCMALRLGAGRALRQALKTSGITWKQQPKLSIA